MEWDIEERWLVGWFGSLSDRVAFTHTTHTINYIYIYIREEHDMWYVNEQHKAHMKVDASVRERESCSTPTMHTYGVCAFRIYVCRVKEKFGKGNALQRKTSQPRLFGVQLTTMITSLAANIWGRERKRGINYIYIYTRMPWPFWWDDDDLYSRIHMCIPLHVHCYWSDRMHIMHHIPHPHIETITQKDTFHTREPET